MAGVNTETICELCDMPLAFCSHGRSARSTSTLAPQRLEESPRAMAHVPGCHHKGDDPDHTGWGYITHDIDTAWQALGNGQPVRCDDGDRPDLVATSRCSYCTARY